MIRLKTDSEIQSMRRAGEINRCVHTAVRRALHAGIRTVELEDVAADEMKRLGGTSSFCSVDGYPASICVSVNDEVGHGIPGQRVIREGDVVKIDVGVEFEGLHSDCAKTHVIGSAAQDVTVFVSTARAALFAGISAVEPWTHLSDVSAAMANVVRERGYSIVKNAYGHGIGRDLHEEPQIPNFGPAGLGPRLRPGMALAIEPVIVTGNGRTQVQPDGWTSITTDGSLGAHFEHTILVHDRGVEILTADDPAEVWRACPDARADWRPTQTNGADDAAMIRLAQQEMDACLLEAWGRPVQPHEIIGIPGASTYVLVESDGSIGGFCGYTVGQQSLYIHTVVLSSQWQGTGMAQWVFTVIGQIAMMQARKTVDLCVQTTNHRAIRFYRKLGFQEVSRPMMNTIYMQLTCPSGVINYL